MISVEQYEELYCTYCDSQRCGNQNLPVDQMCPYWQERMEEKLDESSKSDLS